ncbi:hypothetical protein O6H91_22G030300 [Diphasiastrum complanatum]|uniref:Uncharacterized protein n=1 Tax=Diphasiastrum complanatum TaxID=34168 RepID=A0ACC2AE35_DIPCM|nr:hypothetical protein O6H91_22G030300 [Diphasiastrum complanatum]
MLEPSTHASQVPAFFVFGDSTVDTGNNNYLPNSLTRADNPPYGRDFDPPGPTGRFCNGKLTDDYIAEFLGLPYPIDFYNPQAQGQKLLQGVNFASAGSGLLDQTGNATGSISFSKQLQNFIDVLRNISQSIGQGNATKLIAGSIFLISSGGNDLLDYQLNVSQRAQFNAKQFNSLLVSKALNYTQTLYNLGARKMVIVSSAPLGCLPVALTVFHSPDGSCIRRINSQTKDFNAGLQSNISTLASQLPGVHLVYGNVYDTILAAIQNPTRSGFRYGHKACCGDGKYGGASGCNPTVYVCANASQYVFWDLIHPTQHMYIILANGLISGPQSIASPVNISNLVNM